MTTQRERFEASEVAQRLILEKGLGDEYLTPLARTTWLAWQEAEQQMKERCAKACEEQEYYYINRDMSMPPELAGDAPEGCRGCAEAISALED